MEAVVVGSELEPVKPTGKKLTFVGKVHQKGLTYKDKEGNIVPADSGNNDSFTQLKVEVTSQLDTPMNIAKIAGALANDAYDWISRCKGVVKKAGFILEIEQTLEINGELLSVKSCSTTKLVLTQPSDVASYIARSILKANEMDNGEGLLTGNFIVSDEGKLLMNRMGYSDSAAALPYKQKIELLDIKRKAVKEKIKKERELQMAAIGIFPTVKKVKPTVEKVEPTVETITIEEPAIM